MRVLVTGGTGLLGSELVRRLRDRVEVRVLTRSVRHGSGFVRGDLETGEGLRDALAGVDVVAHCASAGDHRRPQRDVAQTRELVAALGDTRPHLVHVSIVGAGRVPVGLLRAKLESERMIETSGAPWTILRATQFHDLVARLLGTMSAGPVAVVPRGALLQPIDVAEVAVRLAVLVTGGPAGRVPELGGPQVQTMDQLMRTYLAVARRRRRVLTVPLPGRLGDAVGVGGHLTAGHGERGKMTFERYLRSRVDRAARSRHAR